MAECVNVPLGASGSSKIDAKLRAASGGCFHRSVGGRFSPSHVSFVGMTSPGEKSGLVNVNSCSGMAFAFLTVSGFAAVVNLTRRAVFSRRAGTSLRLLSPLIAGSYQGQIPCRLRPRPSVRRRGGTDVFPRPAEPAGNPASRSRGGFDRSISTSPPSAELTGQIGRCHRQTGGGSSAIAND